MCFALCGTLPLFVVVSILAFIGGCAPTTSVQKQINIGDSASISDSAPKDQQNPLLQDIAELSDQEKLFNGKNLALADEIEASNKFLNNINTKDK